MKKQIIKPDMSWIKKAENCSGYFSLKDFASFSVIAASDYYTLDSDPDLKPLKFEAWMALECPVKDLMLEGKKIVIAHLKKVMPRKDRFTGDPSLAQKLNDNTPLSEVYALVQQCLRSSRHNPEILKAKLQEKGISWEQATAALAQMSKSSEGYIQPLPYYVTQVGGQSRFRDYNWNKLTETLKTLEDLNSSDQVSIAQLIRKMDLAINAVHNSGFDPVTHLFNTISNPQTGAKNNYQNANMGDSLLSYMKDGEAILRYLQLKRTGDVQTNTKAINELYSMASEEAKRVYRGLKARY